MKTPQQIRRETIKQLFDKVLKTQQIKISPLNITVNESFKSDFTGVEMSINEISQGASGSSFVLMEQEARGFVDGMFKACHRHYVGEHPSLNNIRLVSYQVEPKIKKSTNNMGTDAETEVTVVVDVKDHGVAEFSCTSRSILHSTFIATLEVFEFYINCEKAFHKIQLVLDDASQRNRGDITQTCISDLSRLTDVNNYEKSKN
tara:strand:- start:72 stop:680 length:609 start_codon:yes stop_codon:yes gene_type:complete